MDSSSGRFPRGRARGIQGSSRPQGPSVQSSRPMAPRPMAPRPQPPRAQPPRAQPPRPQVQGQTNQGKTNLEEDPVEQITQGVLDINVNQDDLIGIGRGSIRGRRPLDKDERIQVPRPEKSLGGKQGSYGSPVNLISNYFPISSYTTWKLYQYRVDFSPVEDRINVMKGLLGVHQKRLGAYIFDGTMLFSSTKYEPNTFDLTSKRYDDELIKITIVFTTVLETCHYAHIQVFNLILRNCLRNLHLQQVGRNFYDAKAQIKIPGHKITLWPGYETSIALSDSGLLWRIEISTKVMRQETVFDFFMECMNNRNRNPDWMTQFKAGVIGATVMTHYNNATYIIDDIDENTDARSTFEKKDGTKMSYIDYYKQKWNITLKCGKQPMLVSKKQKAFKGADDKEKENLIYLIPELCNLTGFSEAMKNNFHTMKAVSEYTRIEPTDRIGRYYNFHKRLKNTPESLESLDRWNLGLKDKLVEIKGRIINPEKLSSASTPYDAGLECDWSKNVRALPMFRTAKLQRWVLLSPVDPTEFVRILRKVSADMGFVLPFPDLVPMSDTQGRNYSQILEQVINEKNPSFILCVIPTPRADIYNLIKKKLCVDRAVPSQVVLAKNLTRTNMSICTKIAIQINCKLGGAPWKVSIPLSKLMIIGFDVCHDKQRRDISYGALVATMNDSHTSFFSCVQRHESGQELSNFFGTTITKALLKYRDLNGVFPSGIVVYRDGVGDGQISHVYKTEVTIIKNTLQLICKEKSPTLAFVIVKKRISTRFFSSVNGNMRNPPPGTIVDSVVTDPSMYDFYLISQNVRFGTVSPTHYNVIYDSTTISPDHMQRLTYKLTHIYFNWAGTVSVPALCQLAHKLAFLTAQSLRTTPNIGLDELLYFL